jgi:hypothetical protein
VYFCEKYAEITTIMLTRVEGVPMYTVVGTKLLCEYFHFECVFYRQLEYCTMYISRAEQLFHTRITRCPSASKFGAIM